MAEALGLAASILQIISTGAQVSLYLYNFAETVSSAEKALKEVSDDVKFTTIVLEELKTALESEKHHGTASKEALSTADILVKECSNVFEAIMALVKKHFPEPQEGQRKKARLNNLKWPFIQPKIENLRSKLERHKTKLILMTQVLTFAKIAASEQRNIDNQIEQERKKLEALLIISHRAKARSERIIRPIGLTEIFSPSVPASVDVVFVHGIFGYPKETWTCDDTDVFWPAELLPPILENETSRVLTYGYDARADLFPDGDAEHKTRGVIESLGQDLVANRQIRKATERPLVFVAHSFGGLVVKGVLAQSSNDQGDTSRNLRSISISTYGIIFLSTPHNLLPSHIDLICDMAIRKNLSEISRTINELKAKHITLQRLNKEFIDLADQYQLCCFREMLEPKILDDLSARLSMLHEEATGIQSNHYMISKFSSEHSPGFDHVCAAIQNYVYSAPKYIDSRWAEERMKRTMQGRVPICIGSLNSPNPSNFYSITPENQQQMSYATGQRFGRSERDCYSNRYISRFVPESSVKSSPSLCYIRTCSDSADMRQMNSLVDERAFEGNDHGRESNSTSHHHPHKSDTKSIARSKLPGIRTISESAHTSAGNNAFPDYQMQLMLLEQQYKKRLLMARQELDNLDSHDQSVVPVQSSTASPELVRYGESLIPVPYKSAHDPPIILPEPSFSRPEPSFSLGPPLRYNKSQGMIRRKSSQDLALATWNRSSSDPSFIPGSYRSRQQDNNIPRLQQNSFSRKDCNDTSNPVEILSSRSTCRVGMDVREDLSLSDRKDIEETPKNVEPNMGSSIVTSDDTCLWAKDTFFDTSQNMSFGAMDDDNVLNWFDSDPYLQVNEDSEDHNPKSAGTSAQQDVMAMVSPSTLVLNQPRFSVTPAKDEIESSLYCNIRPTQSGGLSERNDSEPAMRMTMSDRWFSGDMSNKQPIANDGGSTPELMEEAQAKRIQTENSSTFYQGPRACKRRRPNIETGSSMLSVFNSENMIIISGSADATETPLDLDVQASSRTCTQFTSMNKKRRLIACGVPTKIADQLTSSALRNDRLSRENDDLATGIIEPLGYVEPPVEAAFKGKQEHLGTGVDLQGLVATVEEKSRAKEEIFKLLRQWTTCDLPAWTAKTIQVAQIG